MLTVVPLANLFVIEAAAIWPRKQKIPEKRELALGHVFNLTPQHLWFIDYLLLISVLAIGVWLATRQSRGRGEAISRGFRSLMRPGGVMPALASLSALILITKSGWVAGGTMSNSLIPVPTLFAYFGLFFVFGWLLSGQDDLLEVMKRGALAEVRGGSVARDPRIRPLLHATPTSPGTSARPDSWSKTATSGPRPVSPSASSAG